MKQERNPIDELFREKLEENEMQPSAGAWEKVAAGVGAGSRKKGGAYILRAAVVTLLIALSSLMYFYNNNPKTTINIDPEKAVTVNTKNNSSANEKDDKTEKEKEAGSKNEKGSKKGSKSGSKKEIEPIMKRTTAPAHIYVSNVPEEVDEEKLAGADISPIISEDIKLKTQKERKEPRIKLKYTVPVTQKSFYAQNESEEKGESSTLEKPKFKERVFAYANNQFDNLISGEPLELPKTEQKGKPQLEIDLGKLFNN